MIEHNSIFKTLVVITLVFLIWCIFIGPTQAQNVLPIGAESNISTGASKASRQNSALQTGGGLTVGGTLILKKNLYNQNPTADLGSGTIEFSGTTSQSITGQNTIGTLKVNNPTGLDLGGNITVNTMLILQNGHIRIGDNNLLLGMSASVSGSPSVGSMVTCNGAGEFRKSFSGYGAFTFPVGDNTGISDFTPVSLTLISGTFSSENYVGVKLSNSAYPGSSASYLNRYWTIVQSGITTPMFDAMFQYVTADVVGNESDISTSRVSPPPAVSFNPANTVLHQLSATGVTEFGIFTGIQSVNLNKTLNLGLFLEGLYAGNGTMNKAQNNSGNQFGGNISDILAVELHQAANYNSVSFTDNSVNLLTNGTASLSVPAANNGLFYITIKHRNSVAVTSKIPVSFSSNTITYNFDSPSKAYGDNLKLTFDGHSVFYTGDVNQDGTINMQDLILTGNKASAFSNGYIPEDCNGDGLIDALDLILIDNNAAHSITEILP
ncbi:MAG: hypothetical protein ACOYN4_14350 [Bacteroidales bacterium]